MKTFLIVMVAAGLGAGAAWFLVSNQLSRRHAAALAAQQAAWRAEKSRLESELARQTAASPAPDPASVKVPEPQSVRGGSPREILQKLISLRVSEAQPATVRRAIVLFQSLVDAGPEALPVIREFLARFQDMDYDTDLNSLRRGWHEHRLATDFVLAPSLRIGLLDVARQVGGPQAEQLLAETLSGTSRGVEVAYLAAVLQSVAPNKYRDAALAAARELLKNPPAIAQPGRLDREQRGFLFGVLAMYGDGSLADWARAQLVGAGGQIDRSALRYLERTGDSQLLGAVAQAYENAAITNAASKAPLINAVVQRAGTSSEANQLLHDMVTDSSVPLKVRRDAIGQLDNDGINEKQPGDRDREIALARAQVIEAMKPDVTDPRLISRLDRIEQNLQQIAANTAQPRHGKRRR